MLTVLDSTQQAVSSRLYNYVKAIDEFFANEKLYYNETGSFVRLRADVIWQEGGELGYAADVKIKARIPRTQKKLRLFIESDAEQGADEEAQQIEASPEQLVDETDYYAGVQAELGEENKWRFKSSLGVRLDIPLQTFVRLRAHKTYHWRDWQLYWNETLFWFHDLGTGLDSEWEFSRLVSEDKMFRARSYVRWLEDSNEFSMSQTFSMTHTITERRALIYDATMRGSSDPTVHATDYVLAMRYRRKLYKDYVFYELDPQVRYVKENDFRADYLLFFRLELVFKG